MSDHLISSASANMAVYISLGYNRYRLCKFLLYKWLIIENVN